MKLTVRPLRFLYCLALFIIAWNVYGAGAAGLVFLVTCDLEPKK